MLNVEQLEKSMENMSLKTASEMINDLDEVCTKKLRNTFISTMFSKAIDKYYTKKRKNEKLSIEDSELLAEYLKELNEIIKMIIS